MTIERKRAFVINCAFFVCIIALAYFCFKHLFVWMLPFIIGLLTAACLQRPINWLSDKTRLKKRFVSPFVAFILVTIVALLAVSLIYNAVNQIGEAVTRLPGWYQASAPVVIDAINTRFESLLAAMPGEFETQLRAITADVVTYTQSRLIAFSSSAVSWLAGKASLLPSLLISIIITIVATFFMSVEFDNIKKFCKLQIPVKYRVQVLEIWNTFGKTVVQMLTSYLFIMFITFMELALGLVLLKVPYAVLLAALISLVDILPVLGTGTVLIPWGIISLILGDTGFGFGILAIYVTITIFRNILEPRLVGKRIGLHPLVTLIFMYLGLHVMGIFGMFLFPLTVILIKEVQDRGAIRIWHEEETKTI